MRDMLKRSLYPLRKLAARFVNIKPPQPAFTQDSIIYKAATIIAAEKVEGDYLEFGVFAGASFMQAYHAIKSAFQQQQELHAGRTQADAEDIGRLWHMMRLFAFDSFQGLPALAGVDQETRDFSKGKFACSQDSFCANLVRGGVPLDKTVTIPGWFEASCTAGTVAKHAIKQAAIVHVDCDLYSSAKTVLEFIGPLLTDGSILIFDDWYAFRGNPKLGEQKAFHEWKATMTDWVFSEYQKEGPWRISFIASKIS